MERLQAAVEIGRRGRDEAGRVLVKLRASLHDTNHEVAVYVAVAVLQAEPNDKEALGTLISCLRSSDPGTRESAAQELGSYRRQASIVVPALIERLKDEEIHVRAKAAQSLGFYGPQASAAVPALTAALNDGEPSMRLHSAQALDRMARDAELAIPALRKLLSDDDEDVVTAARQALESIQLARGGKQ